MKPHYILPCLLLLFPLTVTAAERPEPGNKSLSPEKIQQIQGISQLVLAAKRSVPANPNLEVMRQRITELRMAVVKLQGPATLSTSPISLQSEGLKQKTAQDGQAVRAKAESEVRAAQEKIRSHRTALQQKIDAAAGEDHSQERHVVDKVRDLEDEVDQALQAKSEERGEKLKNLSERLKISVGIQSDQPRDRTPTITTIVQHRQK